MFKLPASFPTPHLDPRMQALMDQLMCDVRAVTRIQGEIWTMVSLDQTNPGDVRMRVEQVWPKELKQC